MTQQIINLGINPNDGTGDNLRSGGAKINSNFTELYGDVNTINSQPALEYINKASTQANSDIGVQAATVNFIGYDGTEQFSVETAGNAVNYLTARGGVNESMPVLVANGAATDIPIAISSKGLDGVYVGNGAGTHLQMDDLNNGQGVRSWLVVSGNGSGGGVPQIASSSLDDTNVDIGLVPKGTGKLQYGTLTAATLNLTADMTSLPISGYIQIKDSTGTLRKLAVLS